MLERAGLDVQQGIFKQFLQLYNFFVLFQFICIFGTLKIFIKFFLHLFNKLFDFCSI